MNAGAPTCTTCGGVNTNPQATQCRFCGQAIAAQGGGAQAYGAPQSYGAPQGYASPPGGYGAPQGYGPTPGGYGAPQGYGPTPGGYGAPQGFGPQPGDYNGPSGNPYGPQTPQYGAPQVPVQGFGGGQPFQGGHAFVNRGWSSGWGAFFWMRLAIAGIAIGLSLLGACVSAIAH